ncbi:heat-inducible transcriptional repressor HrcA [Streptococcus danieliae]|uniref:Heat-inducible transcription repressor HrcA n=1 Tax=Streptococcus danieliae TaxID=747656 RepID=A0A7Z0LCJ8_9STRE|nr:heat-inducible transcriptional repressor HrcA [Streptococcus danieliae]MBF0717029.1 heat-inducible transcriptional repressor HrcA [Streptococcus danieliae]NYS48959.1 heat-inducible transcriptional repressor HrcA [Streptococcus danieliae]
MVTERQEIILRMIIELFTETHEPVGSKRLQEGIASSSATIRNDMAALEKMGLLEKSHTSSGRKPSIAGYQYYIENSMALTSLPPEEVFQILKAFDEDFFQLKDIFKRGADLLSEMTGLAAFVLDVEPSHQRLTAFDLVVLGSHTALAVMTLDDSRILTKELVIPRNFLVDHLYQLRDMVLDRLLGESVLSIHYKIRTEIPQVVQRYFLSPDNVTALMEHLFSDLFAEEVVASGQEHLLQEVGLETYRFFTNEQQLALELREGWSDNQEQLIRIADSSSQPLADLSLMSKRFLIPYRGYGLLSLVGPVNSDYQRLLSLIEAVSRVMTMKLTDFYRYLSSNHYEVH